MTSKNNHNGSLVQLAMQLRSVFQTFFPCTSTLHLKRNLENSHMSRWIAGILLMLTNLTTSVRAQEPWQGAPPQPGGIQQAGFHHGVLPGPPNPQMWHQHQYPTPEQVATQYHLIPDGSGPLYDHSSPFDLAIKETLARTWIRTDYLLWNLTSPEGTLLGANAVGLVDVNGDPATPSDRFVVFDRRSIRPLTLASVPDFSGADLSQLNGVRGEIGIPTIAGVFEADVWVLQEASEGVIRNPTQDTLNGFSVIAATTLTAGGQAVNNSLILYSEDYRAALSSNLMGTEGNWVFNPTSPNTPVTLSPIVGFRYVRFHENLLIAGSDIPDPITNPTDIVNHRINSRANNNVFGPQIGFRVQGTAGRVTLSAEPKFMLGINRVIDGVTTQQIFSSTETPTNEEESHNRFAPTFDLSLKARLRVNDKLSLHVGYDLLLVGNMSRAYDNIRYDAPVSVTDAPNVGLNNQVDSFVAHGLVLGGEFYFR